MIYFFNHLKNNLVNYNGWQTNRKIIVFESDDWGAIRTPSKNYVNKIEKSYKINITDPYLKYDSLASQDDLNKLFNTLQKFKDIHNNPVKFTFNTIVANPDFDKIANSNFTKYFYENFTKTLKNYPSHKNSLSIWKNAISEKLMYPQFHGREHVNVPLWIKLLQNNNLILKNVFEQKSWSVPRFLIDSKINLQASLDFEQDFPEDYQQSFIDDGIKIFKNIFDFYPTTFIPNNYIISNKLTYSLNKNNIKGMQGMKYQLEPLGINLKRKKIRRYSGGKINNLVNLIRNCFFEPTITNSNFRDVDNCLSSINNAFFWNKPAIICTHRLNYVGYLNKRNRDKSLILLEKLLYKIKKKWPNVEFMSSNELLELIVRKI